MRVLAMVTSGRVGSAALIQDDKCLGERVFEPPRGHGDTLLPQVNDLLETAKLSVKDIDLFAACAGPGSFTGVRVGLSVATALAWAVGKPVTAINTLEVLAYNGIEHGGPISVVLDARRGEVYGGLYRADGGRMTPLIGPSVMPPQQWTDVVAETLGAANVVHLGSGVAVYPEFFAESELDSRVSAVWLAKLAARYDLDALPPAQPLYVRPSQAEVKFGKAPAHDPLAGLD